MKIRRKKAIAIGLISAVFLLCCWITWNKLGSPTRIALVNFRPFQMASLVKANTDPFVRYEEVPFEELGRLKKYDFVLASGMGMRITSEQREEMQQAADRGVPMYVHMVTNPENNICTLDSVQLRDIQGYLNNGNKRNYRSLASYIRKEIDRKRFFTTSPDTLVETASDVFFHLDENVWFEKIEQFEAYLRTNNFYKEGGARIAVLGGLNDPFSGNRANIDSLIVSFMRAGMNLYPVASLTKRLDFLREINPDAVIYFPHGRLLMGQADAAVEWLKDRNIPLFTPLSIVRSREEWEKDPMGMFGGFLSQSVVMPELDGGIYPYVVNAQEVDDEGVFLFTAIPGRLAKFTQIVNNLVALKKKANADKKVAIFYFKGPGQSALAAQGLETPQSLYNLLKYLQAEGYKVDNLPADVRRFEEMLMVQGAVFSPYAEGAFDEYLKKGNPMLVEKSRYESWAVRSMPSSLYKQVVQRYGEAPGSYMSVNREDSSYLAVARVQFGNVVLLPQPMAGLGDDSFAIVHGSKSPPPHTYIAPYLWAQHGFGADAMLHFGTHGSLEFTPQKQVALSDSDWGDVLVGTVPHFYYYTIANIGESMMAKRRSYATLVSYLSPAFSESKTRMQYKSFTDAVYGYHKADESIKRQASLRVKKIAVEMGLHRYLRLDSILSTPYSAEEIERLENFAEEIAEEKMTGTFYITGTPYTPEKIISTVMAMSADPIAYSLAALDRQRGAVTTGELKNKPFFTQKYLVPAKQAVSQLLNGSVRPDSSFVARIAGIAPREIGESKVILRPTQSGMAAMMQAMASGQAKPSSSRKKGGHPSWIPKMGKRPPHTISGNSNPAVNAKKDSAKADARSGATRKIYTAEQKARAHAILEIERTITNVVTYKKALEQSPEMELQGIINGLSGGYLAPSSGGDAVANPRAVPTGKNLYSVNAENTPSEIAWDKGIALANATIEQYRKQHNGEYPRKVSYTFWSSEFIESEGATIAQVLYMLGVEPVRDVFGRVSDLNLIPSEQLGRPRIDVVVQTSGQFRDIAASRLMLISRAVEMAAKADDGNTVNYVNRSTIETERQLVEQGISPKMARELSTRRVFGGINGMYGTGIQSMITSSDLWESEKEIADTYLNNMGAAYGDDKTWGAFDKGLLRAVLHNTDAIVQPRQSNTWGALSLDHVYEFMGGMNLTIRNVTGKDPDAYFADYRNRNNFRMQDLKEAIGVEAGATVFNPEFVKEIMQGGQSSAARIEEVATNTFGWNVSKPEVIDNEMWDKFYQVYVKDEFNLNVQSFFERENPAALQEITAIMLESARKGMWKASEQQLKDIAALHTVLTEKYGATGKGFSGGNKKLHDFIAQKVDAQNAVQYKQALKKMEQPADASVDSKNGMVLKKDQLTPAQKESNFFINGAIVAIIVLLAFAVILVFIRKRRKIS